jgi:Zn-dependent protease with chaperone function
MRLRHSLSLAVRALLAVGLLSVVLLAVVFTLAALPTVLILEVLGDGGGATTTELNHAVLVGTAVALVITGPGVAWTLVRGVRRERRALLTDSRPAASENVEDAVSAACRRLATHFDVPEPSVRVRSTATPLAYTTYHPEDPLVSIGGGKPTIVVSEGLLAALSSAERDAVLAHELAHLANGDLDLATGLLVPVYAASELYEGPNSPGFDPVGRAFATTAAVGFGVFSRGRELAADRAAAAATGDPAALATALERLDDTNERTRPTADLRDHIVATGAVNVLPIERDSIAGRLGATHPRTATRVERLRRLVAAE